MAFRVELVRTERFLRPGAGIECARWVLKPYSCQQRHYHEESSHGLLDRYKGILQVAPIASLCGRLLHRLPPQPRRRQTLGLVLLRPRARSPDEGHLYLCDLGAPHERHLADVGAGEHPGEEAESRAARGQRVLPRHVVETCGAVLCRGGFGRGVSGGEGRSDA